MTAARKLRAVSPKPAEYTVVTLDRAAKLYPDNADMQRKWLAAVHWMRSGDSSRWILDRAPAKWRCQVEA